ncbi:hypothetical protein Tco_1185767 [Tanacetum coccineum]
MQTDSSRDIRTEVDKEQQTDTDSTERSEQSTESHKYGDEREQIKQTANNRQQQIQTEQQIQTDIRQMQADITNQTISDAGKTRQNYTDAEPDVYVKRRVGGDYHPFCFKEAMKHDGPLQFLHLSPFIILSLYLPTYGLCFKSLRSIESMLDLLQNSTPRFHMQMPNDVIRIKGDGVNDASALKKGDIHIVDADNTDTTRGASVAKDVAGYVKDATMGSVSDKAKMAKDVAECITLWVYGDEKICKETRISSS